MFSNNGYISEKQMGRMVMLPLYASLIFVLPYLAARQFGDHLICGFALFVGMAFIYGLCLYWLNRHLKGSEEEYVNKGVAFVWLVRIWIRLGFFICLIIYMLSVEEGPFFDGGGGDGIMKAIPFVGVCLYGAMLPIEKQGRLYEMLFWLLFIPFLFVIVFGIPHADIHSLPLTSPKSFTELAKRVYPLIAFLLPAEFVLLLQPRLVPGERTGKTWMYLGATVLLCAALSLLMIGIYGVNGAAEEKMLTVEILRCIRLPFRLTERVDTLLIWFFLVACFVLLSENLFFAKLLLEKVVPKIKPVWGMLYFLAKGIVLTVWVKDFERALELYCLFGMLVDVPLSLLIPLIRGLSNKGKKLKSAILISLWISVAIFLGGCGYPDANSLQNIEEQDYATVLLISPQENDYKLRLGVAQERKIGEQSLVEHFTTWEAKDLETMRKQYELVVGKTLSLAHLKAILLPATNIKTAVKMLGEDRELAKTCPVLLWENREFPREFMRYGQEAQAPVGIYLQNVMNKSRQQGTVIPWLLDYEKWIRRDGDEKVCYIKKTDKGYVIKE